MPKSVGVVLGIVFLSCALACDSSILLGERPSEAGRQDASAADAPTPIDVDSPEADSTEPEDCSASNPEGILAATPPMGWNGWNTFMCGSELNEANLNGANLANADLSGASLIEAKLEFSDLRGANLADADLTGADLTGRI